MSPRKERGQIRIAVDIGGTFTDGVACQIRGGRIWVAKRLTTPKDPSRAVGQVIAELLEGIGRDGGDPAARVAEVVHGTTLVTNAIIERKGAKVGLLLTRGTRDTLDIRREIRYDIYDLHLEQAPPLVPPSRRTEVNERLDHHGWAVTLLDEEEVEKRVRQLARKGVDAIAVCLLHAYANDVHERRIEEIVSDRLPGVPVSLSSRVAREIREFERMSTTVANAYVQPLARTYLTRLGERISDEGIDAPLRVMLSSGGFTSAEAAAEAPILLLESGPAAGVLSGVNTALRNGIKNVLTLDMGGTTAKACVTTQGLPGVAHQFEAGRMQRFKKGSGLPVLIPSIDLIEIGAGGGSIAHVNNLGLLNVGPRSSEAVPGPACYGQGGRLPTVTDADLVLGYLDPDHFLGGDMKLHPDLAEAALGDLAGALGMKTTDVAWGIHNLVNENMAAAARVHIAEKGLDPRRLTMVATGGAGPVHALAVAEKLGIDRVLCTIAAGAGSCLGLLAAPARADRSWSSVSLLADVNWAEAARILDGLHHEAEADLVAAGAEASTIDWNLGIEVRYVGQGNAVEVNLPYGGVRAGLATTILNGFERKYAKLFGQTVPDAEPQVVTWRLTGVSRTSRGRFRLASRTDAAGGEATPVDHRRIYVPEARAYRQVPVHERYALPAGTRLDGLGILRERESTIVVARPADVRILDDLTVSITLK